MTDLECLNQLIESLGLQKVDNSKVVQIEDHDYCLMNNGNLTTITFGCGRGMPGYRCGLHFDVSGKVLSHYVDK